MRLTAFKFRFFSVESLFRRLAFGNFFPKFFVGGSKLCGALRDQLIEVFGDPRLRTPEARFLQPDRSLIGRHAQYKLLNLLREIDSLRSSYDYAEFAVQAQS
jgi:hypothetical protein